MAPKEEVIIGLREIYRPPAPIEPDVDIVAVHGLNGSALKTWTFLKTGTCWLNDARFLPAYIKNARVLVWGYDARILSLTGGSPSQNMIYHHAETLLKNLVADRKLSGTADKPIIFLCHSMGGVVVKRALSYAQTQMGHKVSHDYSIFSSTYGILFFGTPHDGSSKAIWLDYLLKLGALATLGTNSRKSPLVSALRSKSETLQDITAYFKIIQSNFKIFYFWEAEPTKLGFLGRDFIVTRESAVPKHDEAERAGIAADHRGMIRFETPSSEGFLLVIGALQRYVAGAQTLIKQRQAEAAKFLELQRTNEVAKLMAELVITEAELAMTEPEARETTPEPSLSRASTAVEGGFVDGLSVSSWPIVRPDAVGSNVWEREPRLWKGVTHGTQRPRSCLLMLWIGLCTVVGGPIRLFIRLVGKMT